MEKKRICQELESGSPLTFRVCKAVFEDEDSYTVVYGIKGMDEEGTVRVQRLVRRLNASIFSQAHLMDLIDRYLNEAEEEERQEKGREKLLKEVPVYL